jgi:hypothetical protein
MNIHTRALGGASTVHCTNWNNVPIFTINIDALHARLVSFSVLRPTSVCGRSTLRVCVCVCARAVFGWCADGAVRGALRIAKNRQQDASGEVDDDKEAS